MSITPFSENEIQSMKKNFQRNGWHMNGFLNDSQRFSIAKNKLLIFTIKIPIKLELNTEIPIEISKFHISIAFQIWNLDNNTSILIKELMDKLYILREKIEIKMDFPYGEKKSKLIEILNKTIPEQRRGEDERTYLNRIRVSIMNKKEGFTVLNSEMVENLYEILESLSLYPSFKLPWELKKGIARFRTSEVLVFSNELSEYFLLEEEGYITFFKDLSYQKYYIRSFFESYFLPFLIKIYEMENNFSSNIKIIIENWIKFSRMILNSLLELVDSCLTNKNHLINFYPEKEILSNDFHGEKNNFALSALFYESLFQKELSPIRNELFNTPPKDFTVLKSINFLFQAEDLIKELKIKEAMKLLERSLNIIEQYEQDKLLVSAYLTLAKACRLLKQYNVSLKYLKKCFILAKSGKIPTKYIVKIHYKLGRIYFILNEYEKALNHFNVLVKFIENEESNNEESNNKESNNEESNNEESKYLVKSLIYIGLIYSRKNDFSESKKKFKKVKDLGKTNPQLILKLFQLRIKEFLTKSNYSQALKYIRIIFNAEGFNLKEDSLKKYYILILLDLAEIFVFYRKSKTKSLQALLKAKELLENIEPSIQYLESQMRWNELMGSYFKYYEKDDKMFIKLQTLGLKLDTLSSNTFI